MRVLVTGGAGYIGSHTVRLLAESGFDPVVVDDLSTGHRESLMPGVQLHQADLRDRTRLSGILGEIAPEAVIHFASHCYVGESVENPRKYFEDNLGIAMNLLGAMLDRGVRLFVFSSSAATYGDPLETPIPESHPQKPVNPYGETKYFVERILHRYESAYGLRSVALRYFNAAGAHPSGTIGESHDPETHLVPLMARAVLDPSFTLTVYGDDYPTPDGTCVRDYVHVCDLADAHVKAVRHLLEGGGSQSVNLGSGTGFSVLEMVRRIETISGRRVKYRVGPRRQGDPPALVADDATARSLLGWERRFSDIQTVIETAWNWHSDPSY